MRNIKLTKNQWERLSEILGNLGLVFFAGVVIPYLLERQNSVTVFWGIILMFISWIASLVFAGKK